MAEARAADDVPVFPVAAVRHSRERRAAGHHHGITNKNFKRDASSGCAEEENKNKFLLAETGRNAGGVPPALTGLACRLQRAVRERQWEG